MLGVVAGQRLHCLRWSRCCLARHGTGPPLNPTNLQGTFRGFCVATRCVARLVFSYAVVIRLEMSPHASAVLFVTFAKRSQ
jgi:hypothetical protein